MENMILTFNHRRNIENYYSVQAKDKETLYSHFKEINQGTKMQISNAKLRIERKPVYFSCCMVTRHNLKARERRFFVRRYQALQLKTEKIVRFREYPFYRQYT